MAQPTTQDSAPGRVRAAVALLVAAFMVGCTPHPRSEAPVQPVAPMTPRAVAGAPDAGVPDAGGAVAPADATPEVEQSARSTPTTLADSVNLFARDLDRQLAGLKGNLFYSPFGISVVLTMVRAGARGKTASEMSKVLRVDSSPGKAKQYAGLLKRLIAEPRNGAPRLRVANRIWAARSAKLVPSFLVSMRRDYAAPIEQLDFARQPEPARGTINRWVAKQTQDKIRDLLPSGSIDKLTTLVLTNAIYLKAKWASPFSKSNTRDEPFYVDGVRAKRLPTMHAHMRARYAKLARADVLELPYSSSSAGPELSMLILLPVERAGVRAVQKELDQRGLDAYTANLVAHSVNVALPRFKATFRFKLKPVLEKLGMSLAFQPGRADFSGMFVDAAHKPYHIDDVYHRAFVRTDETGTEAAAATAVTMSTRGLSLERVVEFRVDHPFLFVIRDKRSGVILFSGRVMDPAG